MAKCNIIWLEPKQKWGRKRKRQSAMVQELSRELYSKRLFTIKGVNTDGKWMYHGKKAHFLGLPQACNITKLLYPECGNLSKLLNSQFFQCLLFSLWETVRYVKTVCSYWHHLFLGNSTIENRRLHVCKRKPIFVFF